MDKIGTYEILETLQQGAKPLYRARAADGRTVALKVLALDGITPEARERFLREAESLRALNRPELVRVLEVAEADGVLYQAMELPNEAGMNLLLGSEGTAGADVPAEGDGVKRAAYQARRPASPLSVPPPPRPNAVIPSVQFLPTFWSCTACSARNPLTAKVCERCGKPLLSNAPAPATPAAPGAKPRPAALYIAIGIAIVLAVALVLVLISK